MIWGIFDTLVSVSSGLKVALVIAANTAMVLRDSQLFMLIFLFAALHKFALCWQVPASFPCAGTQAYTPPPDFQPKPQGVAPRGWKPGPGLACERHVLHGVRGHP